MVGITMGEMGERGCPSRHSPFFAMRGAGQDYAFGKTPTQALARLEAREAALANQATIGMAQECAFLAMGAAEQLRASGVSDLDEFGGQIGFLTEVIRHAPLLAKSWTQVKDEFPGVWLYDVTERFGREWAGILLTDSDESAEERLRKIIEDEMPGSHRSHLP